MNLPKLQRERAVDAAYTALRQAIVSSLLPPGSRLNVDELAGQLGVSLTPVRGAIQRLESEGLVEIRPRSGTFVASLTLQDVEETFQIRAALEALAVGLACARMAPEEMERLRQIHKALKRPLRGDGDRQEHERLNSEFHQVIVASSGNRKLQELYAALHAHIKIARIHASDKGWEARQRQETAEHEAILGALEKRDAATAAEAAARHIDRAKNALLAALRARPPGGAGDGA